MTTKNIYFLLKTLLLITISLSINAQTPDISQFFDDNNISVNQKMIKLGIHPVKGETSISFEKGLGGIGSVEFGLGLINTSKFNSLSRFYEKIDTRFELPEKTLQKRFVPNIWIQPKMYLNEYYHKFYFGFFAGITKLSPEILTDLVAVIGYKKRIFSHFSIELQSGIGGRFFTNTFYLGSVPYEEQLSVIVIPATFRMGYSF